MPSNEKRTVSAPLNGSDHQTIRRLKTRLADLIPLFERMKRCNMPCEENEAVAVQLGQFLDGIEAEFFTATLPE